MIAPSSTRRAWPIGVTPELTALQDGWQVRCFDYPVGAGSPRGSILCQGGRGDFLEKYLECFDHWHAQGWHLSGFDWRGQGGSGRLLPDPQIGHVREFSDWVADLAEYYAGWVARTNGPHIVIGHSMGGHLVLRALIECKIAPDALVLVSPMLGFDTGPLPVAVSAALVRLAAHFGRSERPAWKANERPAASHMSRQFFLTHDPDRYADELWWREQIPQLALGPPSINWLLQAHASNQRIAALGAPEAVKTPVLFLGTDADRLVSPRAIRAVAARIPGARLHMFGKEAAHEILRESDPVRDATLAMIDAFLNETVERR